MSLNREAHSYYPVLLGWGEQQSLEEVAELITTQVQLFLNLDRVMVYRFDSQFNGQVIAEAGDETRLPTMRGLHFPSRDIPPQARSFLVKARQRVIVDVVAKQKILLARTADDRAGTFLHNRDIRYSSVDACHLQYLLGMGVLASITFSIVHQGRLWGLLVGHHSDSRQFSEAEIQTVQLWVDQFSVALAQDLLRQQVRQQQQQEALVQKLTLLLEQEAVTAEHWHQVLKVIATDLGAEGCRLSLQSSSLNDRATTYAFGVQPAIAVEPPEIWAQLCQALEPIADIEPETGQPPILVSVAQPWAKQPQGDLLAALFAPADISSVLMVPIGCRDEVLGYLSCYRQAETLAITWAGHNSDDHRIQGPRASFAAWQEQRQEVKLWHQSDIALAQVVVRHLSMGLMQQWVKAQMNQHSAHDVMTHLPNWLLFNQQLNLAVLQCLQQGQAIAVAILNLDQFKRINNGYGHTFGNYLLQSVAHRLHECLQQALDGTGASESVMLARWHGDRFALLLPATQGQEGINQLAQSLLKHLQRPFFLQGEEIYLTASLGIAIAPYDGNTADALIQHAETAMYQAKQQGHGSYLIYSQTTKREGAMSYQRLANDLYRALTQQELELYYQPQADLQTGAVIGLEVLVRWQHPHLGLIAPNRFIPIAEETGLISQLDEWVLRTACLQYRQWRQAGLPPIRLAVNLSATQFQSSRLVRLVQEVLQDAEILADELELEITEETVTRDIQKAVAVLNQLKQMGVQIALDDFGTGYSSLNVLKHFPVDTLKIDKSFVRNCPQNAQDAAIVQTIIALGHGLKLQVLAEGVETPEQEDWLRALGCDHHQGYVLSRPQPASAIAAWLWQQSVVLINRSQGRVEASLPHCVKPSPGRDYRRKMQLPLKIPYQPTAPGTVPQPSEAEAPVTISSMTAVLQPRLVQQQLKQEQLIRSITEKIRQSLHLDDILSTIVEEVRHLFETDRVLLYKFSEDWDGSVVEESVSPHYQALLGRQIVDRCFAEKYVKYYRQGRVRAIGNVETADIADCHREFLQSFDVKANLVMPVAYQDQLWGLLIAHHCREPRPWQETEVALLGQLAVQAAIAIHQGELYKQLEVTNRELQKLSAQDRLTQLANRHRLDQKLQEEWQRLARSQSPLALILCDVDYFKRYNDTYGHLAGDRCLQRVANVLQAAVQRPADLVARYGGEEFVIVLPETDRQGAHLVAERIQTALVNLALPHGGSPLEQVTLSVGLASQIPHASTSPETLIKQADQALYRAKIAGRNQVQEIHA